MNSMIYIILLIISGIVLMSQVFVGAFNSLEYFILLLLYIYSRNVNYLLQGCR